jgi:hypothetical protein
LKLCDQIGGDSCVAEAEYDIGTRGGTRQCAGTSNATPCPRDERNFACEAEVRNGLTLRIHLNRPLLYLSSFSDFVWLVNKRSVVNPFA